MNSKYVLIAALVAGFVPVAAFAQDAPAAPPADASAAAAAPAPVPPSAYPAKIALIAFEQAVYSTNEGQRAVDDIRKKFQPKKDAMDALAAEVDSLKKQLQAAPATLSDADRAAKLKAIDAKDKQYQREADDAQTAYNSDLQEALSKIAGKVNTVMINYVQKNGYTLLLNVGGQQSQVMWTASTPNADITEAIITEYNTVSGITPPPPAAPAAAPRPKPATSTTPKPATPHTAAPKQ